MSDAVGTRPAFLYGNFPSRKQIHTIEGADYPFMKHSGNYQAAWGSAAAGGPAFRLEKKEYGIFGPTPSFPKSLQHNASQSASEIE